MVNAGQLQSSYTKNACVVLCGGVDRHPRSRRSRHFGKDRRTRISRPDVLVGCLLFFCNVARQGGIACPVHLVISMEMKGDTLIELNCDRRVNTSVRPSFRYMMGSKIRCVWKRNASPYDSA